MEDRDGRDVREEGAENDKLEFRGLNDGRLENFWYYHKWKVIIGLFLAVFIGVSVFQLVERDSPDVYIMYAGPRYMSADSTTGMREAVRSVIADYNGDGKLGLGLVTLTCMTDEQIAAVEEAAREAGEEVIVDKQANQQNIKQFDMEIFGGESVICLLDPSLYDRVHEAGGFVRVDEIFSEEELAGLELYDGSGIYLRSLKFAEYFTSIGSFPDDTVLCIRKVSTISVFKGKEKYEKLHDDHIDAFRRIVLFEYPEGYVPAEETE